MKKIMFSDKWGLTKAVVSGYKTMTRRAVVHPKHFQGRDDVVLEFSRRPGADFCFDCVVLDADGHELGQLPLPYEVGDVVAIAQSYEQVKSHLGAMARCIINPFGSPREHPGWTNKMFVRADLMPHQIRITDLWFERLQAISDEDAMREGIRQSVVEYDDKKIVQWTYFGEKITTWFDSPRAAFAALIDRISGKGTWQRNPWVIAYTFELVK